MAYNSEFIHQKGEKAHRTILTSFPRVKGFRVIYETADYKASIGFSIEKEDCRYIIEFLPSVFDVEDWESLLIEQLRKAGEFFAGRGLV